jgi:hypothetical protein
MKHPRTSLFLISLTTCLAFSASGSLAQEWVSKPEHLSVEKSEYSHYLEQNFPQHVYFGDTHHHSSLSFDSGMFGNTLGPEVSFRFARGEEVTASNGMRAKLVRPLDFLAVTDHAAYLGFTDLIINSDERLMATAGGKEMVEGYQQGGEAPGCLSSA